MAFPYAPRIVYGATTLNLLNSSGMWTPDREYQGGSSESAAGVPESFVYRKDGILKVTIRFHETEWVSIVAWLDWVADQGSAGFFTFYPDQSKALNYVCWLIKPKIGGRLEVRRVPDYVKVLEFEVELRTRTVGQSFDIQVV